MNIYNFLENLENENKPEDLAGLLKQQTLPLVLWGCGDVAEAVYQYLQIHQVNIAGVLVDGSAKLKEFHGLKIKNRFEIIKEFSKFNVILGHSRYELGKEISLEIPLIKKIFYAVNIHYEQYDNVSYEKIKQEAQRFVWLCGRVDDDSIINLLAYLKTKMTGNCSYILDVYQKQMNFFRNDIWRVTKDEVFLDIGAYNGDTIELFLEETGNRYRKIIALEPDCKNFCELNNYIATNQLKNIVISKTGAWNKCEKLEFKAGNAQISSVDTREHTLESNNYTIIHADRVDHLFKEEKLTLIKINYCEGVVEAIKGCHNILCQSHPKLAMDVGFDIYKVLELAEYIDSLKQEYRMYLRFNSAIPSSLTLYAI